MERIINRCERLNALTHGVGLAIGILFFVLILAQRTTLGNAALFRAFIVYAFSFIALYGASTLYHGVCHHGCKKILRVFDHSVIFLFIAGSYTPLIVYLFDGAVKWFFLAFIWILGIGGFCFKIVISGHYERYDRISLALYLGMGWLAIFFIKPLLLYTSIKFILLVALGGVLYSLGTYFYRQKHNPYQHVIWHLFVLAASCCQLWAMYAYLV